MAQAVKMELGGGGGVLVFTSCVKAVQCDGVKVKSDGSLWVLVAMDALVKFVWTLGRSDRESWPLCLESVCPFFFLPSIQLYYAANKFHLE